MPNRLFLSSDGHEWTAEVSGGTILLEGEPQPLVVRQDADGRLHLDALPRVTGVAADAGGVVWVSIGGDVFEFRVSAGTRRAARSVTRDHDALTPPMSATVARILVKPGDRVQRGDVLIALEAMKMELPIRAPRDAGVVRLHCEEGQMVQPGQVLIDLDGPAAPEKAPA
jgi:biotin carboxyl carrier protein